MGMGLTIEGLDDCLRKLDALPANALKICEESMKEAGKPVVQHVRSGVPSEFRRLVKMKLIPAGKMMSGLTTLIIGAFKGKVRGNEIPAWFKMYWKNYGTLTKRDPQHEFVHPVKKSVRGRRNNVGQAHENFFDDALRGWEAMMEQGFVSAIRRREDQLVK